MDKPTFSVCVPMYNVEKYIRHSLEDIKNQTFRDFECLIIDDASSDNSASMAKETIKNDSRFQLIKNKKNLGSALNRQVLLEKSCGRYILFLDADDCFSIKLLSTIAKIIKREKDVDIITWDIAIINENNEVDFDDLHWVDIEHTPNKAYSPRDVSDRIFNINYNSVWTKCFRSDFLIKHNISFEPDIIMGEDLLFSHKALSVAKKIYFIPKKMVYYRFEAANSINVKMDWDQKITDVMKAVFRLRDFLNEKGILKYYEASFMKLAKDNIGSIIKNSVASMDVRRSFSLKQKIRGLIGR